MTQNLELVEKLVEKTGVSYSEAKATLEKTDWDILEAIIRLETEGRVQGTKTSQYSTNNETNENKQEQGDNSTNDRRHQRRQDREKCETGENFKKSAKSFGDFLKDVFDKGNHNCLLVHRKNDKLIELPVTAFVILLVFCFWVVIPLMVVGLFLGCRYSFSGNELGRDSVNNAMGKATDIADNIKSEFNKGN
jgi:Fe2+ transport system protein B